VEDAAQELSSQVMAAMSVEKSKEETLLQAVARNEATKEEISQQVAVLSGEVKALRDHLIEEAKSWCEQHMQRLEFMAQHKEEALNHQQELLQHKVDALSTYIRNLNIALSSARAYDEVIHACHRLEDKVSHIPPINFLPYHIMAIKERERDHD